MHRRDDWKNITDTSKKTKLYLAAFRTCSWMKPSPEEAYEIIRGIAQKYEDFHKVKYKDQILRYIVFHRFLANRKLPDKAIDIMDEAGVVCRMAGRKNVTKADVDKIVFENLGIRYDNVTKKIKTVPNFQNLSKYYFQYFINLGIRKTILNIQTSEDYLDLLIDDFKHVFNIKDEVILKLDFARFQLPFFFPDWRAGRLCRL